MKIFTLLAFSLFLNIAHAQEEKEPEKNWGLPTNYKMVSINSTPLLVQLIPFNRTNPLITGPYNVEFHRFRGNQAFHTSLGMFLAEDANFTAVDNLHFNFRIGYAKRKAFSERWAFYTGWDAYFSVGSLNILSDVSDESSAVLGVGPRWSVGYSISKQVSLSIETALMLGIDLTFGSPKFVFIPPVALNVNFVLPKGF